MVSKRERRRGNAVLEAVLVLPVLICLGFGTAEFGYYFYVSNNLQGAAREGARAAINSGATDTDISTAVAAAMSVGGLSGSPYTVTTSPASVNGAAAGTSISVTVQCSWSDVGVRPLGIIGSDKQVRGTAVMRREQ